MPILDSIITEEDKATVLWHSEGVKGKNGADYDMNYAWIMRVADEEAELKIIEVKGFYDGQKVARVFDGYDLAELRNQG